MSDLQLFPGYAIYGPSGIAPGSVLFAFDLDHTIIKPLRGTFYKTVGDWEFVPGMNERLTALHQWCTGGDGTIVIFTNQGGVEAGKVTLAEVIARIESMMVKLGFSVLTFVALSEQYRKPGLLLFHELIYGYMPEFKSGYYIGDASDAESDFSDTDYRFALNCGLKYIDVGRFRNLQIDRQNVIRNLDSMIAVRGLPRIPVRTYIVPGVVQQYPEEDRALIILVGPPGCGKTTYTDELRGRGWTIISRDTAAKGNHATAAQCLSALKKVITAVCNTPRCKIVMDATHPDVKSREAFIKLARASGLRVYAVVFDVHIGIAKYINKVRCINGGSYVPEIAFGVFIKRYSQPTATEGFDEIITIRQISQNYDEIPDEYFDLYL